MKIALLIIAIGSFAPIWRAAGHAEGMNLWELISYMGGPTHAEIHIPAKEAIKKYEEAKINAGAF